MRYHDVQIAQLGDVVSLAGMIGKIVCSIDTGQYSDDYPEQAWAYLQKGVMIDWDRQASLIMRNRRPAWR